MRKRFVVATNATTTIQDKAFKDQLKARFQGLAWWHRFDELWLIADDQGRFSAKQLRDVCRECFPGKKVLVLEINDEGDTWAALGLLPTAKETFAWLHTNWKDK